MSEPGEGGGDVGNALQKKYGPLPGMVWLLLVFCVAFIFIKSRQGKAKNTAPGGMSGTIGSYNGEGNSPKFQTSSEVNQDYTGATFNSNQNSGNTNSGNSGTSGNTTLPPAPPILPTPKHPPRHQHYHHNRHGRGSHGRDSWDDD